MKLLPANWTMLQCFILQPCLFQTQCSVPSKSTSPKSCQTSWKTLPRQPSVRSPRTCCCGLRRKIQSLVSGRLDTGRDTCDYVQYVRSWSLKQHHDFLHAEEVASVVAIFALTELWVGGGTFSTPKESHFSCSFICQCSFSVYSKRTVHEPSGEPKTNHILQGCKKFIRH